MRPSTTVPTEPDAQLRAARDRFVGFAFAGGDLLLEVDPDGMSILRGMIGLCRELGVKTVAERVETPLQVERLARLQVDFGQGFLCGRPGPLPASCRAPPRNPAARQGSLNTHALAWTCGDHRASRARRRSPG